MRIVVAMDSFKGSLSAVDACEAVREGILRVLPEVRVALVPMADGGEGTAQVLAASLGGERVEVEVTGPLPGMSVKAGFVWLPERGPGALIEMATASGLGLLSPDQFDPLAATTYGTGQLIALARERGARRIWLAIGGSATVDGGVGAATALGWRFLDQAGRDAGQGGEALERIADVDPPPGRLAVHIDVLCDVSNPLLGPAGAARVFGPQKGATPEMVERLESGLANLADVIERVLGVDVRLTPGSGAAGGLGAGAVAFLSGRLVPGVEAVIGAVDLEAALEGADWVVTGEGRYDEQSLQGKVVSGVTGCARRAGCRVAVLAGSVAITAAEGGVDIVEAVRLPSMPLEVALARASELLADAAERFARERVGAE